MDYIFFIQVFLLVAFFAVYNKSEELARVILGAFFISLGVGIVMSIYCGVTGSY